MDDCWTIFVTWNKYSTCDQENVVLLTSTRAYSDFVKRCMQQYDLCTQYNVCTLCDITASKYYRIM